MKKYFVLLMLIIIQLSFAGTCDPQRKDYFCIEPTDIRNAEMTESEFYKIPFEIYALYIKEIQQLPYPVLIKADWKSPYFGAGVSLYENSYNLMILGGTTRMKEMTLDGYAAIVCHEFGHLFGGDPKQTITGSDWASAEGQADHFAASKCLEKFFINRGIKEKTQVDLKIEKAGFDFLNAASKIESSPQRKILKRAFVKLPVVNETIINQYPSTQCRYESYRNPKIRPTCWFKD